MCSHAAGGDVNSRFNESSVDFVLAAMRWEEFNASVGCSDMLAVLPTCGAALRHHWLLLLAAMVAAGGAAAAITIIGWGRVVSRRSRKHRYHPAGATDNLTSRAGDLQSLEAGTARAAGDGSADAVELGSWRLQSTSLRLRRQDFEFLRGADGQLVMLGQGGTAKASGACL